MLSSSDDGIVDLGVKICVTARDSRCKGLVTFEGWIGVSFSSGMSSSCCDVSTWSP